MSAVGLHCTDEGLRDGPAVLLLGSLGSSLQMWEPQVHALARRFRVVRADLRGHGRSPAPPGPYTVDDLVDDVVALLDRLGIGRTHVVGLSLGGMTAMRLAARCPERLDRLALMCTSAMLPPATGWTERAVTVRAQGTGAVARSVVSRWLTPAGHDADPERVRALERMVSQTPPEGYAACCEAIAAMDLRADLARITAPTLVLAGDQDPATPTEHLEAIAAGIPDARLLVVPGAAHLASLEQADAVNLALGLHLDPPGDGPPGRRDDGSSGRRDDGSSGRPDDARRHAQGMRVRRAVLGDAHVEAAVAGTTRFSAAFQDFITRTAWGDVWCRPGLSRRDRSIVTLAALTSLGHENETEMHVRGALANGLTPDEIAEVLLHTAIYAGVPAANTAFARAARVIAEHSPAEE